MKIDGTYLVTLSKYFYAEDGIKYNAVWGELYHKNNYITIGSDKKCIHFAISDTVAILKCENKPKTSFDIVDDLGLKIGEENNGIYII